MKRPDPITMGFLRARAVRPRGVRGPQDGRWYWRAQLRRRDVWTGWANPQELVTALAKLLVEGVPEEKEDSALDDIKSVQDLVDCWFDTAVAERADLSPRTVECYREGCQRIRSGLGDHQVERLGRAALDQWVTGRQRQNNATTTISADLGTLQQAWRWGRQVGACPDRDLAAPRLKASPKARYTPKLSDVAAVVRVLEAGPSPWVAVLLRLAAATGARVGELASLTWDRVDLEAGLIELQGKTGARIVPLRSDLISLLSSLDQSTSTVLGVSTLTARHPGGYLAPACEAAGVRYFTMHGLRRLAVDRLARAGIDIGTAAAILGHTPEIMLAKYRQVGLDERRRAVAALDRLPRGEVVSLPQAVGGFGGHRPRSQGDDDLGGL